MKTEKREARKVYVCLKLPETLYFNQILKVHLLHMKTCSEKNKINFNFPDFGFFF